MALLQISTSYVYPPIPIRSFDWSATLVGFEGEGGSYEASGTTEEESVANLLEGIELEHLSRSDQQAFELEMAEKGIHHDDWCDTFSEWLEANCEVVG
jgi:hypothetical protein